MDDNRLPTHLRVGAFIRSCSARGIPVAVIRRGEKMSGTVLFKLYETSDRCQLMTQMRDTDNNLKWYSTHSESFIKESDAINRIRKSLDRDPDLWVIEVETKIGDMTLTYFFQ